MSGLPLAKVSPAKRNEAGECIDMRCTRMGYDGEGGVGVCCGYHCLHCDTPTGMMGHRCPENPAPDSPGLVAIQAPDLPTEGAE